MLLKNGGVTTISFLAFLSVSEVVSASFWVSLNVWEVAPVLFMESLSNSVVVPGSFLEFVSRRVVPSSEEVPGALERAYDWFTFSPKWLSHLKRR